MTEWRRALNDKAKRRTGKGMIDQPLIDRIYSQLPARVNYIIRLRDSTDPSNRADAHQRAN